VGPPVVAVGTALGVVDGGACGVEAAVVGAVVLLTELEAAALEGEPEVITAVPAVAKTSTALTTMTRRSPARLRGKLGIRSPIARDRTHAQSTNRPAAI
jgi:hypothetical protein